MVKRLCLQPGCGALTDDGRCSIHKRNKSLAREMLDFIYARDRGVCGLCGESVPWGLRGTRQPRSPSIHHVAGTSDHESNLVLACLVCNQEAG
jgi:hypothetical protein